MPLSSFFLFDYANEAGPTKEKRRRRQDFKVYVSPQKSHLNGDAETILTFFL
jgi:hypothetical protein